MAERPFETRTVVTVLELREDDAAGPMVVGHAATFNQPYQVGFFTETIHPEAFKRTLANGPDVRLLVDHEGQPLARTKSGTLQLGTDAVGLTVSATLDSSDPDVQRLVPKMRRGDLDQMSFAFRVPSGGDAWDHSGDMPTRTVREASLSGGDVSIVTYPANENASVALRGRESREAHATYLHAMVDEIREGRAVDMDRLQRVLDALQDTEPVMAGIKSPDDIREVLGLIGENARAAMSSASMNDLPDSAFAYIESGGEKDSDGKTTPRSLRHFPIHDEAHVRNALARAPQSPFGEKAMPKILAAAKKFGIETEKDSADMTTLLLRHAEALRLRAQRAS